jgi:hypothetical protein
MALVRLSEVEPGRVSWLWEGRIPLGAITLLDGDGGVRKSTLTLNIAAAVSSGRVLPGNAGPITGGVLLLGEEDGLGDTVLPRLSAMGADLTLIHTFSGESLTLADDLPRIEKVIQETHSVLMIVDPVSHFIGVGNQERRVRTVLTRVGSMLKQHGVALLGIRHLTKERLAAQVAGFGSVAIGAVARSGLLLAPDPSDSEAVVLAHYKCNLAPLAPSLQLRFEGVCLASAEETNLLANDLVRPTVYNEHSALGEAMSFLRATLSDGGVRTARVFKLAASAGVKYRTLRKAKDALGVESKKSDAAFDAPWFWRLPGDERLAPDVTIEVAPPEEGHLLDLIRPSTEDEPVDDGSPDDDDHPEKKKPRKPRRPSHGMEAERDVEAELAGLTGLASVKQSVLELRGLLAVSAERKRAKLPAPSISFHAIFAGNPGTGKTTVARIYAKLLKQYGRVSSGHLVEVDRSDLVAEYMGQTAVKTRKVLQSALGGVLFIDEAYALKQRDDDSFGQECIDTILKFIEDHRDEMVVILAGYAEQMDGLLASNPGFRSRFAQRLAFDDYNDADLLAILHGMLKKVQYGVEPATEQVVACQLALERASGAFGNGRAVRNLIERAIRRHAVRINARTSTGGRVSPDELVLLLPEDFVDQMEASSSNKVEG